MLDEELTPTQTTDVPQSEPDSPAPRRRRRAAGRPAGPPPEFSEPDVAHAPSDDQESAADGAPAAPEAAAPRRRSRRSTASVEFEAPQPQEEAADPVAPAATVLSVPLFQPPPEVVEQPRRARKGGADGDEESPTEDHADDGEDRPARDGQDRDDKEDRDQAPSGNRRRRSRGKGSGGAKGPAKADEAGPSATADTGSDDAGAAETEDEGDDEAGSRRRRRRRRRTGEDGGAQDNRRDEVTAVKGSTRIEAKKQRRREGRESGRRRAPIVSEAEFLARRESVKRTMLVRQQGQLTQIVVMEDGVLVEHYVNQATATSLVGNVYLGRVQNVLPSMEAAFVDVGRGRNAVLYAGEVNWDAAGMEGQPKRIEQALSSGDKVLVQVTKDPVGHKGARLTSQVSLPGRFVVYVPDGSMTGISRKLPDKERSRLRTILRSVLPEGAGVIVRTAAEGASEEDLTRDVEHLMATWEQIQAKAAKANPPTALHTEPDLALRIVRDIFNSDFESLVVSGDEIGQTLTDYVNDTAPSLGERVTRWTADKDLFAEYRVDEQLAKALDRKVYLPSGGSLVIDRTEAMTVVDVNTGRFTGQGGNLEETVTRNNLEAAEELVRQIRLRDCGGIIVIDFIDMVLENNRDLVLRRLIECLGRDRTKHQVAEVTSLGLVQMTRKRIGQGLLETFSEPCDCCNGRGVRVHVDPVEKSDRERRPRSVRPPGAHDPVEAAAARAAAANGDADDVTPPPEPAGDGQAGADDSVPDAPTDTLPTADAEAADEPQPDEAAPAGSDDGTPAADGQQFDPAGADSVA